MIPPFLENGFYSPPSSRIYIVDIEDGSTQSIFIQPIQEGIGNI